jgi:hypothetical protein
MLRLLRTAHNELASPVGVMASAAARRSRTGSPTLTSGVRPLLMAATKTSSVATEVALRSSFCMSCKPCGPAKRASSELITDVVWTFFSRNSGVLRETSDILLTLDSKTSEPGGTAMPVLSEMRTFTGICLMLPTERSKAPTVDKDEMNACDSDVSCSLHVAPEPVNVEPASLRSIKPWIVRGVAPPCRP